MEDIEEGGGRNCIPPNYQIFVLTNWFICEEKNAAGPTNAPQFHNVRGNEQSNTHWPSAIRAN